MTRPPHAEGPVLLAADWVLPVLAPPIRRGGVLIEGEKIAGVGPAEELRRSAERSVELPGHVLTPGLINAHCHLELSDRRGAYPPTHFVDWVVARLREGLQGPPAEAAIAAAVRVGMSESLQGGVTTVGDITRHVAVSRGVLRAGPLQAVSFGEITAIGTRRAGLPEALAVARDRSLASATLRVGLSPHAPYTVEGPALRTIVAAAGEDELPVCMHLAELAEEAEFLATLGGRLREPWDIRGTAEAILDAQIPRFAGGPVRWAKAWGLLAARAPVVLAHVNYADDAELEVLAGTRVSVAYCPRTRAFFGHGAVRPHRFEAMLERDINVCLGTDSLASNPDLFVLREAQFVLRQNPGVSPDRLLELVTWRGARALETVPVRGALQAGLQADIAAFPLAASADDVVRSLIATAPEAGAVWIRGDRVA